MRILTIATWILLTGCAASQTSAPLPASSASQPASSATSATASAADASATRLTAQLEVDASSREQEAVVCRREAPVGSRIPILRCDPSRSAGTAESVALDEQRRQDIEETRRQRQLLLEQQRMQSAMGGR